MESDHEGIYPSLYSQKKICIISMSKKTLKNKMKKKYRIESDVLGEIKVEDDKYWGAETQRSIIHFSSIGQEKCLLN